MSLLRGLGLHLALACACVAAVPAYAADTVADTVADPPAIQQAKEAQLAGDFDKAERLLTASVQTASATPEKALYAAHLANLLYDCGEFAASVPYYEIAAKGTFPAPLSHRVKTGLQNARSGIVSQRIFPKSFESQTRYDTARKELNQAQLDLAFKTLDAILLTDANALLSIDDVRMAGAAAQAQALINGLDDAGKLAYKNHVTAQLATAELISPASITNAIRRYPLAAFQTEWYGWLGNAWLDTARPALAAAAYSRAGPTANEYQNLAQTQRRQFMEARRKEAGIGIVDASRAATLAHASSLIAAATPYLSEHDLLKSGFADINYEPVAVDVEAGMVYISNGASLSGLTLDKSEWRFSYEIADLIAARNPVSFRRERTVYYRSPALTECVSQDGVVIWRVTLPDGNCLLSALDSWTGGELWTTDSLASLSGRRVVSGPCVRDGMAYIAVIEPGQLGQYAIYALDIRSGAILWRTLVFSGTGLTLGLGKGELDSGFTAPALSVDDERVYYTSHMGCMAAADRLTGQLEWLTRYDSLLRVGPERHALLPFFNRFAQPPMITKDAIVAAPRDCNTIFVLAKSNGSILHKARALSQLALVGASDDRYFVSTAVNSVRACSNAEDRILWEQTLSAPIEGPGYCTNDRAVIRSGNDTVALDMKTGAAAPARPLPAEFSRWQTLVNDIVNVPVATRNSSIARDATAPLTFQAAFGFPASVVSSDSGVVVESRFRMQGRTPKPPYSIMWAKTMRSYSSHSIADGTSLYWCNNEEFSKYDIPSGNILFRHMISGYSVAPTQSLRLSDFQYRNAQAALLICDRGLLEVSLANGKAQNRFDPGKDDRILHAADGPSVVAIVANQIANTTKVIWLDAKTLRQTSEFPLLFPDGLRSPASLPPGALQGKKHDEPLKIGDQNTRLVGDTGLAVAFRGATLFVLTKRGLIQFSPEGAMEFFPFATPLTLATMKAWPQSVAVSDKTRDGARHLIVVSPGKISESIERGIYATDNDRLYRIAYNGETPSLHCLDAVTGQVFWKTPEWSDSYTFYSISIIAQQLALACGDSTSGEYMVIFYDKADGREVSRMMLPYADIERVVAIPDGYYAASGIATVVLSSKHLQPAGVAPQPPPAGPALIQYVKSMREQIYAQADWNFGHPDAHAIYRNTMRVDGDVNDWEAAEWTKLGNPDNWIQGPKLVNSAFPIRPAASDLSALVSFAHHENDLWGCIQVRDDHYVTDGPLFCSDSVRVGVLSKTRYELQKYWMPVHFVLGMTNGRPLVQNLGKHIPAWFVPWPPMPLFQSPGLLGYGRLCANPNGDPGIEDIDVPGLQVAVKRDDARELTVYEFGVPMFYADIYQDKKDERTNGICVQVSVQENDGQGYEGRLDLRPGEGKDGVHSAQIGLLSSQDKAIDAASNPPKEKTRR